MYILSERKRGEPDPDAVPRVATYWYLLRPEMCTGRHKSPHSHGVPNLHILRRVLLYISLVLSHSLSLLPPFFPSSFLVAASLPPLLRAMHRFLMTLSSNFLLFPVYADAELFQTKDSLASSWNVAEIRTNKEERNVKCRNAYLEECDSILLFFLLQMTFVEIAISFDHWK